MVKTQFENKKTERLTAVFTMAGLGIYLGWLVHAFLL